MSFKKEIELGQAGKLIISEEAGVGTVEIAVSESVGGGQAAGVLKATASAKVELDGKHLIDLGLELAAHKFPAAAALIESAKNAIDSQLAKA